MMNHDATKSGSRIRRLTLTAQVYSEIKRMLFMDELRDGALVNEVELARLLGVSPTPVREALNLLKGEGLICADQRTGTRVTTFSDQDVAQLMDLRATLECKSLREAAPILGHDDFRELDAIHSRYVSAYASSSPDYMTVVEANDDFHLFFARKLQNRWLEEMLSRLTNYLRLARAPITRRSTGFVSVQEHEAILEALRKGEFQAAESLLAAHLRRVSADLLSLRRELNRGQDLQV